MNGRALGSLIGAVGGLVFVAVNAGGLSGSTFLRVVAVLVFLTAVGAALRIGPGGERPSPRAMRIYGWCVIGEVLAIPIGARVLTALDHPELVRVWVVLVLGVHFVPFAQAFSEPVYAHLGYGLVTLAVLGGAATLAGVDRAELWTAVAAGFVLLLFSLGGAVALSRRPVTASGA